MKIWAIVPVKPFVRAKSRLSAVLAAPQREALAERMFRHGLHVLSQVRQIAGVMVVSRDSRALALARDYGAHTIQESGAPELNDALRRASEFVRLQGADGVLVIPADLPLYTVEDVEQIVHMGRYNTTVVLVPDRNENGTNALLVTPPGFIPFSFGPGSFRRHMDYANKAGATVKIYHSERIGLDIDTPDDLDVYFRITGELLEKALD
jgi:2-phospho-L-lactate guanylyltransferase